MWHHNNNMQIIPATSVEQLQDVRMLFEEYAVWLGVDLTFQGFQEELRQLPGPYTPPRGRVLLGSEGSQAAGCVALRPLAPDVCEMKRLYVRPGFRGRGMGCALARKIIQEARQIGYSIMRLDTLASMTPAITLYESLGFTRCAAYYDTPLKDTVFMQLPLV